MENRKPPTEVEVKSWLKNGYLAVLPLRFKLRKVQPKYSNSSWDFEVEASWGKKSAKFAVEYKSIFTPKAFEQALSHCRDMDLPKGVFPLVMLPYLRPSQLAELESNGISGVDWCGNGVVIVPEKFQIFRAGGRNQFASYSPIKNIYRKNTSMVARVLLASSRFASVREVLTEVNRRDMLAAAAGKTPVTMGTISKALKQLEDELIVDRSDGIQLLQADKLLDQLKQNYEPPSAKPIRLKVDSAFEQLPTLISTKLGTEAASVATGLSSVGRYATMQREEVVSLYCTDAHRVQTLLEGRQTDRFPNVELIETGEQPLYFDARQEAGFYWASPVQTWLELMCGDKRDRETAEQVQDYIVRKIRVDQ